MKKTFASAAFIVVFAIYAAYHNRSSDAVLSVATTGSRNTSGAPVVSSRLRGAYIDGVYTGKAADAYYGTVQVRVTIAGGKIADVTFLNYPSDRSTSRMINLQAVPELTREAIAAQNANVSGVSGASDTSAAFKQSLASALSQAKA